MEGIMKHQVTVRVFSFFAILSMLLSAVGMIPAAAAGSTRVLCEADATLVGCWRMEEGSGTTLYDGGAAPYNDGTLSNSPAWVAGKIGNSALAFSGTSSQYVSMPDQAS